MRVLIACESSGAVRDSAGGAGTSAEDVAQLEARHAAHQEAVAALRSELARQPGGVPESPHRPERAVAGNGGSDSPGPGSYAAQHSHRTGFSGDGSAGSDDDGGGIYADEGGAASEGNDNQ